MAYFMVYCTCINFWGEMQGLSSLKSLKQSLVPRVDWSEIQSQENQVSFILHYYS